MLEQSFKRIISGQATGILPMCARGLLWLCSWPYRFAMWYRGRSFDSGRRKQAQIAVPVIAIGNLTTGGTGKTPVVAWVVQQLQHGGRKPGIVSRGYGADDTGVNDEKRVLEIVCPNVPHEQNPNRVDAANKLIADHAVDVIVCDDAFQHRQIARDLNVVLIDATNPFGYEHLLPRGLLREPVSGIKRADIVVVTRADHTEPENAGRIINRVVRVAPHLKGSIFQCSFQPTELVDNTASRHPLTDVADRNVSVMTGIGNPDAFVTTCKQVDACVVSTRFFPDHHHYTTAELEEVRRAAVTAGTPVVLTTLKDLVKVRQPFEGLLAINIETVFESDSAERAVADLLIEACHRRQSSAP